MYSQAKDMSLESTSTFNIQLLDRAVVILDILWTESPTGLLPHEISQRSGLHKSTVHRLLLGLQNYRFVEKDSKSGRYRLGLRLFELGQRAIPNVNLREKARPYLERLVFETGETAHLCVLAEHEILYLDKVESPKTIRIASSVGGRNPAYCSAVGKVLLSALPEAEIDGLLRRHKLVAYTRNTIITPAQFKAALRQVQQNGYAVDNEEREEGLRCIGAPIHDHTGEIIAAMSVAGPAFRLMSGQDHAIAQLVTRIAGELSAALGYHATYEDLSLTAMR
jgi:IclR family transcriptional regulator, KDG regulon repressor